MLRRIILRRSFAGRASLDPVHLSTCSFAKIARSGGGSRAYAFDAAAAQAAAQLLVQARTRGLCLHQIPNQLADLQIAGVALAYRLELAARNAGDFAGCGITLVDPWEA